MQISLGELATLVDGVVEGEAATLITGLSPIDDILPGTLVYADANHIQKAESSKAEALLVNQEISGLTKHCIRVKDPFFAFTKLLTFFYPQPELPAFVHPSACIASDVVLGKNVYIGPCVVIESGSVIGDDVAIKSQVYIGAKVSIGQGSVIHPNVTIYEHSLIGKNVIIHAGTIIGCDGFGYTYRQDQHVKTPHVGSVVIEDDVEIGGNVVIDRATLGKTVIGKGTKIDNLVQIAHSVKLGKHNILCAFTGIAGSSSSGDYVTFAADVGVADHVTIEDQVTLAARTGVPPGKTLKKGQVYLGTPAKPKEKAIEMELAAMRIPLIRKQIQTLTEKLNMLTEKVTDLENE